MAIALLLGACIGTERQMRGRMAGLRTNALVSLGAAGFVVFAALFPDDINPTRVAAQVVSGIGFLGAGIIFRDGFNFQGINTAATLWCSAAVGLISGTGHALYAVALTGLIVFANLGLRPVVRKLKGIAAGQSQSGLEYHIDASCLPEDEEQSRAVLLGALDDQGLTISKITKQDQDGKTRLTVVISRLDATEQKAERSIALLALSPVICSASWEATDDVGPE